MVDVQGRAACYSLIKEPEGFREILTDLPADASFTPQLTGRENLAIWFVTSEGGLREQISRHAKLVPDGGIWIAWPKKVKKASGRGSDLSEKNVRETGLAAGLVDYKIASIDTTWSGLKFARKKQ